MAVLQSFNSALEKEGKKKKELSQHGVFVVGHPAKYYPRRTGRIMLLSLWYSDYAERFFSEMRKAIHLIPKWRLSQMIWVELHENEVSRAKRRCLQMLL